MAPKAATSPPPAQAGAGSTGGPVDQVSKLAEQEHTSAKQELVVIGGALPDYLRDMEGESRGVSTDQADNTVPRIYLLQNNSPQVSRHNQEQYVEGAEPGDIWLKNAPQPIVKGGKGSAGLLFQPCWFGKCVNEWIPRNRDGTGGGFIARHNVSQAIQIPGAQEVSFPGENPGDKPRKKWMNQDRSHEYIETREHVGIAYTEAGAFPFVLSFSSTGHQTSKDWMPLMQQKRKPDGKILDSFVSLYCITTWLRTRGQQKWFQMSVTDGGLVKQTAVGPVRTVLWATPEQYKAGLALYEAFASGAKQAAAPDAGAADEEPGSHDGGEPATGKDDQIPF